MPKNSPDFLTLISTHNAAHDITLTFSEMKKTARRISKAYEARPATDALISADEFLRIHWSDPTAETAMAHLANPAECDHLDSITRRMARTLVAA